jgi:hypothetical protein
MGWDAWITIGFLVLGIGYLVFSRPNRRAHKSGSAQTGAGAYQAQAKQEAQARAQEARQYQTVKLVESYTPTGDQSAPAILGDLFVGALRLGAAKVFGGRRVEVVQATDTSNHATPHATPVQAAGRAYEEDDQPQGQIVPPVAFGAVQAPVQAPSNIAWDDEEELGALRIPPRQPAPVQAAQRGNMLHDMLRLGSQTLITLGKDPVANTASALGMLPEFAPAPPKTNDPLRIPVFFDGEGYISYRIGKDGDIGVFGLKGAGKGNFLRYFALNCAAAGPDKAVVVIFDAKGGVDYWWSDEIPHVDCYYPSTSGGAGILGGLQQYQKVMDERYTLLRKARVENANEYNELIEAGELEGVALPYIVMIVDEVADFDKKEQAIVDTLVRMARAAGFVILIATQYPTTDALSSQAANNLNNRLVFRTGNSQVTRVYLGKTKEEGWLFEPAVIPTHRAGVAIWRQLGMEERIGLVPYLSREYRDHLVAYATRIGQAWAMQVAEAKRLLKEELASKRDASLYNAGMQVDTSKQTTPALGTEAVKAVVQATSHATHTSNQEDQAWADARAGELAPYLSDEHLAKALGIVETEPSIALKELARRLYAGNFTGDYFYAARVIKARAVYQLSKRKSGSSAQIAMAV